MSLFHHAVRTSRRQRLSSLVLASIAFAFASVPLQAQQSSPRTTTPQTKPQHPNVLFIAVDDLRPELKCYGRNHIHSPNIDALAAGGIVFERAYCMVPTCGASRSSLMTGLRPARNRFVNYLTRADRDAPGVMTLNTCFKQQGYHTVSNGKVFHHATDNVEGWSEKPWRPQAGAYRLSENVKLQSRTGPNGKQRRGPAYEAAVADGDEYADGMIANRAIEDLARLSSKDQPFFLAVGFMKPHLPFVAPQKYWDLYDRNAIDLPDNYRVPDQAPANAVHNSGELRAYHGIPPKGPVSEETARAMIHGYYACVSFVDAQIGRVLDELDRLKLSENTIVVLWGDHGWNLGDHTMWCKHSCFESSLHAPLIVRAPGYEGGLQSRCLIEFIDIYPTLCELAAIDAPPHLQGRSFVSLLNDPKAPWKDAAISRFQSGDSIRTEQYRFTQYSNPNGRPTDRMLYDHESDPLENRNIAEDAGLSELVESISDALQENMGRDN